MAKRIVLFVLLSLSVFTNLKVNAEEDESPDYIQYVHEVTSSFLKQVHKEFGFEWEASGGCLPYNGSIGCTSKCIRRRSSENNHSNGKICANYQCS